MKAVTTSVITQIDPVYRQLSCLRPVSNNPVTKCCSKIHNMAILNTGHLIRQNKVRVTNMQNKSI